MMAKLFSSFYSKLALAVLLCFLLIAALLLWLGFNVSTQYQQEVEQKLHQQLAAHLVHDNALLEQGDFSEPTIKATFHNMMILGPRFEFYMLDAAGNILNYSAEPGKVKRDRVSLQPIRQFLSGSERLPMTADDPRHPYRQKIFSVAPIETDGQLRGYLYIIIGGEQYDGVAALLRDSHIMTLGGWGILLTLSFSLLTVLVIFALLTRPLRQLASDISSLHQKGFEQGLSLITQWKQDSQDEIQKLGSAFNAMADKLNCQYQKVQNTDQLRRELVSYVSHDLRTPLSSLQGYLETWQLKHTTLTEEASENLIQVALDNARKTSQLVEQLFELAHLDSDSVTLHYEPVAVAELAQDVIQKLELNAMERGVKVSVEPQDPGLIVMADIQRIERVFTNLLDNAIRHCQQGDRVSVQITPRQDRMQIAISDTGCGIPQAELPQIFEPHFRATNSANSHKTHSGLGLAIARRILELHSSAIQVVSKQEQGTTFSFELPCPAPV